LTTYELRGERLLQVHTVGSFLGWKMWRSLAATAPPEERTSAARANPRSSFTSF